MSYSRQPNEHPARPGVGRRAVLRGLGTLSALSALGTGSVAARHVPSTPVAPPSRHHGSRRLVDAYHHRRRAARFHTHHRPPEHRANGDESLDGYLASFTKGLPHDELGTVDAAAYETLLAALDGRGSFDDVPLGGDRKLVNPQAALSYVITGPDPHDVTMPPAPRFDSPESAAEMAELYWQALLRDVPFDAYEGNPVAEAAAADLSGLSGYAGPRDDAGRVTADLLFRGPSDGDRTGPYLSQFFYYPIPRGDVVEQPQLCRVYEPGVDYLTDFATWLDCAAGAAPADGDAYHPVARYLHTGRDLSTYVHRDYAIQPYLDAALVLHGLGAPANPGIPPTEGQSLFVDFGPHDVLDAVPGVLKAVQGANWAQKWLVHRRLRPEAFGAHVHSQLTGVRSSPIHADLLDSPVLDEIESAYGSYLLPQAYPEGSPLHPSYPAGHAGIAGACVTVLKAFFDESWLLPNPVAPSADGTALVAVDDPLSVGDELNKLASNMSIGRNWAGIHYRSDADAGIRMGERVAIGFLADRARLYDAAYGFEGFRLTTFDGERIRVTADGAVPA